MYLDGIGVNRDRIEALKWFLLASEKVPEAAKNSRILIDEMSDVESAQSRSRVVEFKSKKS